MILRSICSGSLAAFPSVCVPGLCRLLSLPGIRHRSYHVQQVVTETSPFSVFLDPLELPSANVASKVQDNQVSKELLRYSTHFPEALYGNLAGLVQSRPFPTAVDMSCAAVGVTGAELAKRGFRVAEVCPPSSGCSSCAPRLPGGVSDVVTLLPGPRDLHAPELLAEARRLMAAGGYLAVAWNDRDLSSPFVSDLESLLESINPHYCRSSRQHNPPAVLSALCDGGALALQSFSSWAHSLSMARAAVLQDLLGGFAVVRPHLAASSTHRKAFHQEVRALVRRHFGDEESPFELPLITKLYVLKHTPAAAAALDTAAHTAAAATRALHTTSSGTTAPLHTTTSSSSSCTGVDHSSNGSSDSSSASSSSSGCSVDDGCMTHHVRTRRAGLSSRDCCTLRHLYA